MRAEESPETDVGFLGAGCLLRPEAEAADETAEGHGMGQAISRPDGEMERLVAVRSIMSFKNAEMPELKVLSQLGQDKL